MTGPVTETAPGTGDGWRGLRSIETPADIAEGLAALSLIDARLLPVIAATGPVPLRRGPPGYAGLAEVIVGQMVSKASAAAIWSRLSPPGEELTAARMAGLDAAACGGRGPVAGEDEGAEGGRGGLPFRRARSACGLRA